MILKQGDCLKLMKNIPDKSVDMILCDLPYGRTANKWDAVINLDEMWVQYRRIIKDNGAIALFGMEPFSSMLRTSNLKMYRYDWIWVKDKSTNFLNARRMPLRKHENISVFYKHLPTYIPQMSIGTPYVGSHYSNKLSSNYGNVSKDNHYIYTNKGTRFPTSVLNFKTLNSKAIHPTQKPVELLKYLIRTYTNKGDTVLDNCMGSGSTGVACVDTERSFIGYELNKHYFDIAKDRIEEAQQTLV